MVSIRDSDSSNLCWQSELSARPESPSSFTRRHTHVLDQQSASISLPPKMALQNKDAVSPRNSPGNAYKVHQGNMISYDQCKIRLCAGKNQETAILAVPPGSFSALGMRRAKMRACKNYNISKPYSPSMPVHHYAHVSSRASCSISCCITVPTEAQLHTTEGLRTKTLLFF